MKVLLTTLALAASAHAHQRSHAYRGTSVLSLNNVPADLDLTGVVLDELRRVPSETGVGVDITVLVEQSLSQTMTVLGAEVVIDDFAAHLDQEAQRIANAPEWVRPSEGDMPSEDFFLEYRRPSETYEFTDAIYEAHSDIMTKFQISTTVEGQSVWAYTINTDGDDRKPGFYMEAQLHAREWLAGANNVYTFWKLMEDYGNNVTEVVSVVEDMEFTFTPIVNLDGVDHTWDSARMWRKNRSDNGGGVYGTDLNRNWGPEETWCTQGSSTSPRSDTYCGTGPFSEPELQGVAAFLDSHPNYHTGIDFHTSGPLLLYPFQYSRNNSPQHAELKQLYDQMADVIQSVHGVKYDPIRGVDLYAHSGGFIDYNYCENNMYTTTVEGRGPGFDPNPSNIIPAGEELYAGVMFVANYVKEAGGLPATCTY